MAAAEELLMHLVAGDNPLADDSGPWGLARVGAQTLMTRVETDTLARISDCQRPADGAAFLELSGARTSRRIPRL